ncbi:MAG: hypothetical protein ACI4QU_02370 [Christensenellales bacterium]
MAKLYFKEINNIEKEFFDIDEINNTANIVLRFEKPSDIFDNNYVSKTPVLSDDFLDWISSSFKIISKKYKINLEVQFDDLENFNESELENIFKKNILLEYADKKSERKKEKSLAWSLIGVGTVLLIFSILMNFYWQFNSITLEIVKYVFDIAVTVTYWEAFTILIVRRQEIFGVHKDILSRFSSIKFSSKRVDNDDV